ncbi:putative short-chain dehydrogenase [Microthyrium microscopicum]|uniref:Putative short-chain dehydrogenase n=1 Tax=Microthyrium microscopicum TaxID=703497 RepID=A0A6A6UF67_9PEZI|nr:putative short-chain dehydrogenase [Microthyrium microscopicum]
MSLSSPIALIFGAGKNTGAAVANAFFAKGYKIATVSRTTSTDSADNDKRLHIQSDMADPKSVSTVFQTVRKHFGEPSVVVYNAAANAHMNKSDPLQIPLDVAAKEININVLSALAAAKEAVVSFESLKSGSKSFIYTGNILNQKVILPLLSNGMGKSAAAHLMHASSDAYKDRGYRFYYADERTEAGEPVYSAIDGKAHGAFYVELSEKGAGSWLATFVKGKGYVDFSAQRSSI